MVRLRVASRVAPSHPAEGFSSTNAIADLYEQIVPSQGGWIHGIQMAVKKTLGFTVPLIHARGVFNYDVGLLPYRHEINTVGKFEPYSPPPPDPLPFSPFRSLALADTEGASAVGAPIFPPSKTAEPTDQEVAEFQQRYIDELQRMWDQWKDVFAGDRRTGPDGELKIIE